VFRVIGIWKNKTGWECDKYGRQDRCTWLLIERPEVKRPLGKPRLRWEGNIKMDITEVGWEGMDWIEMA
jgi:hypothetical protein